MLINMQHSATMKTAAVLAENAEGLRRSIMRMKESLAPLQKNWYVSGSLTGNKVKTHEEAIDQAMGVITQQMTGTGDVMTDFSRGMRNSDETLGA